MSVEIERIEEILTSEYSTAGFVQLVQELFDGITFVAPDKLKREYSNFSSHIAGYSHVGNYTAPDGKKMIVFSVELQKRSYVESSRSTQRSYAKKLIENAGADAAMVAFYTPEDPKWRISYIRLDYEMKFENGKLKTAENLTPAKRYSFLVGKDEPCHTAVDRFRRFLDDQNFRPTLDELEEAFSVEAVTKEFFNLYCEKFRELLILLEDNPDFAIEAEHRNFTAAQFAKKLMGQIVFLYFLQKKGWLGVKAWPERLTEKQYNNAFYAKGAKSRELIPVVYRPVGDGTYRISAAGLNSLSDSDEEVLAQCVHGNPWGTGPRNFMRKLFEQAEKNNVNFFNDYLEPLFYDALNVNRGEQGYDPALHCRIPFLSGGLFEPIDGYDWKYTNFDIPNTVFSNRINNNPRTGNGILDIFDRYNFTMAEDEPMEREVAIDPEMLGKVFENLLEVKDRKSKGAFYTPREIVHYMCQESLINYLTNTLNVSESAVRDFILYGDFMKSEDTVKEKRQGNGGMLISEELFLLAPDGSIAVNRLADMDRALADVRVADPAVGSGAFPLGMLNEIVRARQNISGYMAINMRPRDVQWMYTNERSPYRLKRETIKNCIFAADIEPSAVDIAQLRLWLSLVIDDEINPDAADESEGHRNPTPLPNLECNILCGNSLIDRFEGIPLINQNELIGTAHANQQTNMFQTGFDAILPMLIDAQNRLFNCDETHKKHQILAEIASLRDRIIMSQIRDGMSADGLARYEESKKAASKPYVLWQLDFARVFKEKGGFDIVMGNPPYIQLQKAITEDGSVKLGDLYVDQKFETFAKTGDIYCLFYEKGWQLLHPNGVLAFITSNKWMRAGYGKALRGFLSEKTNPLILLDFSGQKIFESATVDVNILLYGKTANRKNTLACIPNEECHEKLSVFVQQTGIKMSFDTLDSWIILSSEEHTIKNKIDTYGIPLSQWDVNINYGIKTGLNDAFIIDSTTKDAIINADPHSAEIIRPILRGRDIKRFSYDFADLWLIVSHNGIKEKGIKRICIDDYPAIKAHFDQYFDKLKKRADKGDTPYNLRNCAYMDDFSRQKIAYAETMRVHKTSAADRFPRFSLVEEGFYHDKTSFIITGERLEYILGIMNSKLMNYYIHKNIAVLDTGGFLMQKIYIDLLPIPNASEEIQTEISKLVIKVVEMRKNKQDSSEIEDEIDNWVYDLFELTKEEIAYIENSI